MPRIHLVQCLCPKRHCIMAVAGQEPPGTPDDVVATLKEGIEQTIYAGRLNPWCELCKAKRDEWTFEVATVDGVTLEEVLPGLKRQEAEQLQSQAEIKAEDRANRN